MDLTVIVRLEEKVDQLLDELQTLQEENLRLRERQARLEEERQVFRRELDLVLGKLPAKERRAP
ncbi:hypothetical protein JCM30471_14280 [Desulfuromonas carbonis]|uniref:cell division protein ZapB n=1 Tax=Desulfuromonas sp. DDH964 TaxID=1823759 RepID=UPI00078B9BDB|nr:cell division protein ZapB [Desulfuromonas sp. DDH964]AMV73013.1 cell division protein ZapB [Desulfuromonas sp. DDH964]